MSAPDLIVTARRAARRCPLCRDALTALELLACGRCGTAYHGACVALNRGRCAVLGCGGEAAPPDPRARARFALAVGRAPWAAASQLAAVAQRLELSEYDAGLRLRPGLPLILGYREREELAPELAELRAAGLTPFAVEAAALTDDAARVRRVAARREQVLELELDGEGGTRALDLAAPRLVISARIEERREREVDVRARAHPAREQRRAGAGHRPRRLIPVLYVFERGEDVALAFERDVLRDFRFLGAAMGASGEANFRALAALLGEGAAVDTALESRVGPLLTSHDGERRVLSSRAWCFATARLIACELEARARADVTKP